MTRTIALPSNSGVSLLPRDWTLMAIASAKRPLQPVQLQKSLFLLARNLSREKLKTPVFYSFDAYDYGPFCSSVYSDSEALEAQGLVAIQRPPESRFKMYSIKEAGAERAADTRRVLDLDALKYLDTVVSFTQSLSFNQLVKSIYNAYPEMKANSVFERKP